MNQKNQTAKDLKRLLQALEPLHLEVIDNSHLHRGHEGAKAGGGHFAVRIVSTRFEGMNAIKRHRLVYQAVDQLLQSGAIHALEIDAISHIENQGNNQ